MLDGHLYNVRSAKGFDCNQVLTDEQIATMKGAGYQFCFRYIKRTSSSSHVDADEAERILDGGLALGLVQHVANEGWEPTPDLGTQYGSMACEELIDLHMPPGMMCWLDLEGVQPGVPAWDVIQYCNRWHEQVAAGGYLPGIYVGWHAGLTGRQLYIDLRFTHYWRAFNLNDEFIPKPRGFQVKQGKEQLLAGVRFDPDEVQEDGLGGTPIFLVGAGGN